MLPGTRIRTPGYGPAVMASCPLTPDVAVALANGTGRRETDSRSTTYTNVSPPLISGMPACGRMPLEPTPLYPGGHDELAPPAGPACTVQAVPPPLMVEKAGPSTPLCGRRLPVDPERILQHRAGECRRLRHSATRRCRLPAGPPPLPLVSSMVV